MRSRVHRHRKVLSPLVALALPLLLGAAAPAPSPANPATPANAARLRPAAPFATAADALRARDCSGAVKGLDALAANQSPDARLARILSGLYSHVCQDPRGAEARLYPVKDPGGQLEDWRLLVLAESSAARGHLLLAQTSLARLLGDYPASPLRPRALLQAARLHWQRGEVARALELVGHGRAEALPAEWGAQLEELAWEIGTATGDDAVRLAAGRRLLAHHPSEAARLAVVEAFRQPDGTLDWAAILAPRDLLARARSLLALDLAPSAVAVLDAVAPAARDLKWHLLKAEALTRDRRGLEALTLLAGRTGREPRDTARLEWARAQAADEAAIARGRANLPAAERERLRWIALAHLQKTADGADPELAVKALRRLWAAHRDGGSLDRSVEVLRALRRLDPADTTGLDDLWQQGWRQFLARDYTGAVRAWTELAELYPEKEGTRRGRYWAARAFELLGETERAQQIYREVVAGADTTDLYRKSALARLTAKAPATPALTLAARGGELWPADPTLARTRLLTDVGLDQLARAEMELVSGTAETGALDALEALILAREGQRRASIQEIRKAFPALGGAYQATLPAEALALYYPLDYQDTILSWARTNQLPGHLVFGMIRQESAFDTNARSWAGARGLMQLMPATARELAGKMGLAYSHEELSNPAFNVRLGTAYFSDVLDMFGGNVELALAGYNGGPYRIKRLWRESGEAELDRFLEDAVDRGVEDLRQAHPGALRQLPAALSPGWMRRGVPPLLPTRAPWPAC